MGGGGRVGDPISPQKSRFCWGGSSSTHDDPNPLTMLTCVIVCFLSVIFIIFIIFILLLLLLFEEEGFLVCCLDQPSLSHCSSLHFSLMRDISSSPSSSSFFCPFFNKTTITRIKKSAGRTVSLFGKGLLAFKNTAPPAAVGVKRKFRDGLFVCLFRFITKFPLAEHS